MRDLFRSYYRPSDEEFSKIWEECIFCFDANVLLNIYRYSPKTRERFFEILSKLKERIWIPHQAAYEYQEDRLEVISTQEKAHQKIRDYLHVFLGSTAFEKIKNQLNEFKRHPSIDISEILGILEKSCKNAIKKVEKSLKKAESEHPDLTISDEFRETLTDLLDGKIGNPYSPAQLNNLYQEAQQRFSAETPPGYKDSKKEAPKKYGDFVLWKQLIDRAILQKKPLIFVTDDTKEDWWLKHEGKTIQPRRELLEEFRLATGVDLWMYPSGKFLEYAENFLTIPHQPEILEEAEAISLSNENPQEVLGSTEATSKDSMDTSESSQNREAQKAISRSSGLDAIRAASQIPSLSGLVASRIESLDTINSSQTLRGLVAPIKGLDAVNASRSVKGVIASLLDSYGINTSQSMKGGIASLLDSYGINASQSMKGGIASLLDSYGINASQSVKGGIASLLDSYGINTSQSMKGGIASLLDSYGINTSQSRRGVLR
jgi:hypothetical protein